MKSNKVIIVGLPAKMKVSDLQDALRAVTKTIEGVYTILAPDDGSTCVDFREKLVQARPGYSHLCTLPELTTGNVNGLARMYSSVANEVAETLVVITDTKRAVNICKQAIEKGFTEVNEKEKGYSIAIFDAESKKVRYQRYSVSVEEPEPELEAVS